MRIQLVAATALLLAGCGGTPPGGNVVANIEADNMIELPVDETVASAPNGAVPPANAAFPPVEPIPPGQPGGLPDDRTPIEEGAMQPGSAQDGANVVQSYYALLESGRAAEAYRLWQPDRLGMTGDAFVASFAKYAQYNAQVGAPGRINPGAGQRYVTVPVQVYGRLKSGEPVRMLGSMTLHRAGDIDGASAEQKRWRIYSSDLKPRPGP